MKKALTALLAAATVAGTLATFATDADAQRRWRNGRWVGPAIGLGIVGGLAYMATRPRGYVVYEDYGRPVYGAGCYWASQPIYNRRGQVVGYAGEPVMVCPGY